MILRGVLGPLGNEQYRSYIEDIHMSGRHLLDLINDILDFSKAEAGQLVLAESQVDVPRVVTALMRLMDSRARDASLAVHDLILPSLWCDERKLKQMVLNLLSNAVKFTPGGGRIEIDAECSPAGLRSSCAIPV